MATLAVSVEKPVNQTEPRNPLAFKALLVFVFLYNARPEDVIPGLSLLPLSKIVAAVAAVALISVLKKQEGKIPTSTRDQAPARTDGSNDDYHSFRLLERGGF